MVSQRKSKRKADDWKASGVEIVTVQSEKQSWEDCKKKLVALRTEHQSSKEDRVLTQLQSAVNSRNSSWDDKKAGMVEESNILYSKLQEKIQAVTKACQKESEVLYQLKLSLTSLKAERDALAQDANDADQHLHQLKEDYARFQKKIQEISDQTDEVLQEQMETVPRLKHQISLYASCTGIKWDFDQENVLAGQVVSAILFVLWTLHPCRFVRRRLTSIAMSTSCCRPCRRWKGSNSSTSTRNSTRAIKSLANSGE